MILFHNIITTFYYCTVVSCSCLCMHGFDACFPRFVFRKKEVMVRIVLPVLYYFLIDDKNSYLS